VAFDRVSSTFTDVVGLSASAAYPTGSSVNPANDDFLRNSPGDPSVVATGSGFYIPFETGPQLTVGAASVSARVPRAGTIAVAYARAESNAARDRQGDLVKLDSQDVTLRYSQIVSSWASVGGEFRISDSGIEVRSTSGESRSTTTTDSVSYDLRIGGLIAPGKNWLIGLVGSAGFTYSQTRESLLAEDTGPADGPSFPTFTRSISLRPGIAWRPVENLGVYLDLQYLRLWTDHSSVSVGRVLAGLEYVAGEIFAARIGGSVDSAKAATVSTGLGFYPSKHVSLDIAYVYNAFPEMQREFGRAHLFSAALTLSY
jgi:opacity protein-like surface antigen